MNFPIRPLNTSKGIPSGSHICRVTFRISILNEKLKKIREKAFFNFLKKALILLETVDEFDLVLFELSIRTDVVI